MIRFDAYAFGVLGASVLVLLALILVSVVVLAYSDRRHWHPYDRRANVCIGSGALLLLYEVMRDDVVIALPELLLMIGFATLYVRWYAPKIRAELRRQTDERKGHAWRDGARQ